jgi:hypothetical protein
VIPADGPVRVFVGSSSESNDLSAELVSLLNQSRTVDASHWADVIRPGDTTIETLEAATGSYDYAIFVAAADDVIIRRGHSLDAARDNVILELGLFVGALGRRRTLLVVPDDLALSVPSDLNGVTVERWEAGRRGNPSAALRAVAGRLGRLMSDGGPRVREAPLPLLSRDDLGRVLPSLNERIGAATRELWISGNDCKEVVESRSAYLRKALEDGVRIKVLCADPDGPQLPEMLAQVDPRFPTPAEFRRSMVTVQHMLRGLREEHPDRFEFRYLRVLPALGFFAVDPADGGLLKVEFYTPKPWAPLNTRPHLVIPPGDTVWRPYFLNCWANYWAGARVP